MRLFACFSFASFLLVPAVQAGTITINTNSDLGSVTTGFSYSNQLLAAGAGSIIWSVVGGSLPAGLNLSAGGLLSGTPTTSGTYAFGIRATDPSDPPNNYAGLVFTLNVTPIIVNTSSALPLGNIGIEYTQMLTAAGGTGAITWTVAAGSYLPPGLTLASNGALSGTPAATGQYNFTITATDTANHFRSKVFDVSILPLTAWTGVATAIGASSATLNGTANPSGSATLANFAYGRTKAYGSTTPSQDLGSSSSIVSIGGGTITGLACHTLYHFRAVATSANGPANGADATFTTAACRGGDFDGDTKADVLWRNRVTGENIAWLMSGLTVLSSAFLPTVADVNWDVAGVGDLNGGGKADVLLRNKSTGQYMEWLMDGLTVANAAFLSTIADTNWEIKGVGDLDDDGTADVILRNRSTGHNAGWLMNGLRPWNSAFLPTVADTNWESAGLGDLDADGKSDVLLRNKVTGQIIGWLMNGLTVSNAALVATIADTNWEIKGIGDFDGDGKTDVVLRNKSTGQNVGWLMDGLTLSYAEFLPTIADTNWEIQSVRDFDGDGRADILWRNKISGQNIGWLMDEFEVSRSAFLPTIADTNWEIVGQGR